MVRAAVVAGIAVLGMATLLGFLDGLSWLFELPGFFRVQYAAALGALAVAAILLRLYPAALSGIALVAVNAAVVAPVWAPQPEAALIGNERLRVLLVNVEEGNNRYQDVAALIEKLRPDVVGITELTPAWAESLEPALDGYRSTLAPQADPYGIGLYSRVPLVDARIERFPQDGGPPSVVATSELDGRRVTLVVTHVHTPFAGAVHERQLEAMAAARPRLGTRLAVCGDFNAVPWSTPLRRFASDAELQGISRTLDTSWPTWNPLLGVPLDNCFLSDGLVAVQSYHGPDVGSDHLPLVVELGLTRLERPTTAAAAP